jgi:predicted dehydrogenase
VAEGGALTAEVARRGLTSGNPDGAFVTAVASGTPSSPDLASAVRAHEVVDAAYRSAATNGTPIPV